MRRDLDLGTTLALGTTLVLAGPAIRRRVRLPARRDLPAVALTGLVGIALYNLALNRGERSVTAGAASLPVNAAPVFTALLAAAFLGERRGTIRSPRTTATPRPTPRSRIGR